MSSLEQQALDTLPQPEQAALHQLVAQNPNTTVEDVLRLVQERQQLCRASRLRFKRSSGETVDLQDAYFKVVTWIQKFREIGDVVIQYDPAHAALPWAAMRFILQAFINDTQSLAAVAEGLEFVTKNYSRCKLLETVLLRNSNSGSDIIDKLRGAIVSFYSATLTYLARATKYYSTRPAVRIVKSTFKVTPVLRSELELLRGRVDDVQRYSADVTAETVQGNSELMHKLSFQLASFETPIVRMQPLVEQIHNQLSAEEQAKIVEWICPIAHRQLQNHHSQELTPGTGVWLQQRAEFLEWQESSTSAIFWLKASPGWGKTKATVAFVQSMLSKQLSATQIAPVLYFYCSSAATGTSATIILRSLVRQLSVSMHDGKLCDEMHDLYYQRLKASNTLGTQLETLSSDECVEFILRMAEKTPLTIVIDGLDEIVHNLHILLHAIDHIMQNTVHLVKVFVSSRPTVVGNFEISAISYNIRPNDTESDIRAFVRYETSKAVKENRLLRGKVSEDLQSQIVQTLSNGSNGMFLWSSLQLSNLCNNEKFVLESDVSMSLSKLSRELRDVFDGILERILQYEYKARKIACNAISWLLMAQRPLSKSELLAACLIDTDTSFWLPSIDERQLITLCGNLIVLDEAQSEFYFIHLSVREYLSTRIEFSEDTTQLFALERCLVCYTEDVSGDDTAVTGDLSTAESFQNYACCYWMNHYQAIKDPGMLQKADDKVLKFAFDAEGLYFDLWLREVANQFMETTFWTPRLQQLHSVLSDRHSVVHTAAAYNILCLVNKIVSTKPPQEVAESVNNQNSDNTHAIYTSARFGNFETLRILLKYGAEPNVKGGHMGTPLQAAAYWGHKDCLDLLLDNKADPMAIGRFPNGLDAALAGGKEDVIMTFLERQLYEANDVDKILNSASKKGLDAVIKVITQQRDSTDFDMSHKCLQNALAHGNLRAARVWITKVDDIDAEVGHYGTALQAATFGGNVRCISMVVEKGASIDRIGLYGSALKAAALKGHQEAVEYLLDHGARDYDAATEAAAQNGHASILQLLLDHGESAKDFSKGSSGILEIASVHGQALVVKILLTRYHTREYGPVEESALQKALFYGNAAVITEFLSHYPRLRGIPNIGSTFASRAGGFRQRRGVSRKSDLRKIDLAIDQVFPYSSRCSLAEKGMFTDGGHTTHLSATGQEEADTDTDTETDTETDTGCPRPQSRTRTHRGPSLLTGVLTKEPLKIDETTDTAFSFSFGCSYPREGVPNDGGHTMRIAARVGNPSIIKQLLRSGLSATGREDVDTGWAYPIEVAAAYGHITAVDTFIDHGAELERSLLFATRFEQTAMVRHILELRSDLEVDLKWDDFACQNFKEYTSESLPLTDCSALGLAIELDNYSLFELLWEYKIKSSVPLPNLSFVIASTQSHTHYLDTMLGVRRLWMRSDLLGLGNNDVEARNIRHRSDILNDTHVVSDLNGHVLSVTRSGSDAAYELCENKASVVMRSAAEAVVARGSYETLKKLLDVVPEQSMRLDLMVGAARAAYEADWCDPSEFLEACSAHGKTAAVLLEVALTGVLRLGRDAFRNPRVVKRMTTDRICEILNMMQNFYEADTESLDTALARLCQEAILGNRSQLVHDILEHSLSTRKPLKHNPRILHDLVDTIGSRFPHEVLHLPSLFQTLVKYGANTEGTGADALFCRVCIRGLGSSLFILIDHGVKIPPQSQVFPVQRLFSKLERASSVFPGVNGSERTTCDLLDLTIRSFQRSFITPDSWRSGFACGYSEIIYFLLDSGYFYDLRVPQNIMFCRIACFSGNYAFVYRLIEAAKGSARENLSQMLDETGVLHAAALGGDTEMIENLIQLGANPKHSIPWYLLCMGYMPDKGTPVKILTSSRLDDDIGNDECRKFRALKALITAGVCEEDEQRAFGYAMVGETKRNDYKARSSTPYYEGLLRQLIYKGIDITAAEREYPYLEAVVQQGRVDWLTHLIEKGLDVRSDQERLLNLLQVALEQNQSKAARFTEMGRLLTINSEE